MQIGELESLARLLARIGAEQRGERIALNLQSLAQRRQRRFDLGESGFLQRDVVAVGVARTKLRLQGVEHLGIDCNELVGGVDLAAQSRFVDRGDDDIRRQRQIGRFDLELLIIGQRLEGFDRPAIKAPDVEGVGDLKLRRIQGERIGAAVENRGDRAAGSACRSG